MQNLTDTIDKSSSWKKALIVLKLKQMFEASRVQVVSRQKLKCNQENIEVNRVKYNIFSIQIEFFDD